MRRFFENRPFEENKEAYLSETVSHHIARVLRMQVDEAIILFNGFGGEYHGRITIVNKKQVTVFIEQYINDNKRSSLHISLGQCISKGERMDYAIQKATELGVTQITPIISTHSEMRKNKEAAAKKQHYWQQVAISACEQCGLNLPPNVQEPMLLSDWLSQDKSQHKIMLDIGATQALSQLGHPQNISLLVGPEGGLSSEDRDQALQAGFLSTHLGPRILRTETAPIAALSILQYLYGDLS